MKFEDALKIMKSGGKVKLPSWGGGVGTGIRQKNL